MKIKVDDCFPDVTFFQLEDGNPKTIKTSDIFNEKKDLPYLAGTHLHCWKSKSLSRPNNSDCWRLR